MSAFNAEKSIEKSVQSILDQTFEDFEFLIVDDCSTDITSKILNRFSDERIKLYKNKENIGLTKSLNFLINNSKTKFIVRQDADDYSHKRRIEEQYKILIDQNIDFCVTRAQNIQNLKKIPGLSYFLPYKAILKYKNPFIHGTLMIQKKVLLQIGMYDEEFVYAQDYKLFSDLIKSGAKGKKIYKVLYYLNTKNNISSNFKFEQRKYANLVRRNFNS